MRAKKHRNMQQSKKVVRVERKEKTKSLSVI